MSKKYKPGNTITSVDELLKHQVVFWLGKTNNMGFIQNLQLRTVKMHIDRGFFKEAIKIESEG